MKVLCVDTATPAESVAVVASGGVVLAEHMAHRPRGHGRDLLDTIDHVLGTAGLSLPDLDQLVCGLGPGSFTGLRIGLATLKALAFALGIPLRGVPTWALLTATRPDRPCLAVVDARRRQVYAAGAGLDAPICCAPGVLRDRLASEVLPEVVLGSGALLYRDVIALAFPNAEIPAQNAAHLPRAALAVALVDFDAPAPDLAATEPRYVRPSDAEINYPDGFPSAFALAKAAKNGR